MVYYMDLPRAQHFLRTDDRADRVDCSTATRSDLVYFSRFEPENAHRISKDANHRPKKSSDERPVSSADEARLARAQFKRASSVHRPPASACSDARAREYKQLTA